MNKLKKYRIKGFDIESFKIVVAVVSAFSRKDALNAAFDHYHMLFPTVHEV